MIKLDTGQITTYVGGTSVWLNGFFDITYGELLSTIGLALVIFRISFDAYKYKKGLNDKKIICFKCSEPITRDKQDADTTGKTM